MTGRRRWISARRAPHAATATTVAIAALLGAGGARADTAGPAPRLEMEPASLTFSEPNEIGVVTLRNAGGAPLHLGPFRILMPGAEGATDFGIETGGPRTLAPGESMRATVSYRHAPGARRRQSFAALLVGNDDPRSPPDALFPAEGRTAGVALRAGGERDLLGLLIFSPLLGLPFLLFWPRGRERGLGLVAPAVTALPLALAAWLLARFDPSLGAAHGNFGFQFVQQVVLSRALGVEYHVGVDGLSLPLVALAALVTFVVACASSSPRRARRRELALLLVAETGALGFLSALDLGLVLLFWEVTLLALAFLAGGGEATARLLVTGLGSAALIAAAGVALHHGSKPTYLADGTLVAHTLDVVALARGIDFAARPPPVPLGSAALGFAALGFADLGFARVVWALLFAGFAVAIPAIPLAAWFSAAVDRDAGASPATAALLAAVLPALGIHGLLRLPWAILPEATRWASPFVAALGAAGIAYGGVAALAMRRRGPRLARASIAGVGVCLVGVSALTPLGIEGALLQLIGQGLAAPLAFLAAGALARRQGDDAHTDDDDGAPESPPGPAAAAIALPRATAPLLLLALLSLAGLPGLAGFFGPLLALVGSFGPHPAATIGAAVGLVALAGSLVPSIRLAAARGDPPAPSSQPAVPDLAWRERAPLLVLAILLCAAGLLPTPALDLAATGVEDLLAVMRVRSVGLGGGR